jgi:hypothetical protein
MTYIIGCMPIVWRITKATNTHTQYVILIAFPRQPCLHERHQCCFIPTLSALIMLSPHLWPRSYLCDQEVFVVFPARPILYTKHYQRLIQTSQR